MDTRDFFSPLRHLSTSLLGRLRALRFTKKKPILVFLRDLRALVVISILFHHSDTKGTEIH
jgi:hypothetical protein